MPMAQICEFVNFRMGAAIFSTIVNSVILLYTTSNNNIDFLAKGVKIREDNVSLNADGGKYLLFSIGEQPLKYAVAQ